MRTPDDRLAESRKSRALRLQHYLPYRLSVAANAVSRVIQLAYEEKFGITIPQWRLIAVLADEGALTQQELCGRTIMDKVTVTRAAQGLLRRRLVKRLPNSADGRSHRLMLTKGGESLYAEVAPLALEYETKLLADLKPEDIAKLEQHLRLLERAASELRGA
jgi:DNA-binding MarR family transcriptional regulator